MHSHNQEFFLYPLILILMIMIKLEHKLVNEKELINKCSLRLNKMQQLSESSFRLWLNIFPLSHPWLPLDVHSKEISVQDYII